MFRCGNLSQSKPENHGFKGSSKHDQEKHEDLDKILSHLSPFLQVPEDAGSWPQLEEATAMSCSRRIHPAKFALALALIPAETLSELLQRAWDHARPPAQWAEPAEKDFCTSRAQLQKCKHEQDKAKPCEACPPSIATGRAKEVSVTVSVLRTRIMSSSSKRIHHAETWEFGILAKARPGPEGQTLQQPVVRPGTPAENLNIVGPFCL